MTASPLGREAGLSGRESSVLRLIVQGHTTCEIAERLHLSINSIKTYIRTTYRKIGVKSRLQAVTWAIQHGFPIEREEPGETRGAQPDSVSLVGADTFSRADGPRLLTRERARASVITDETEAGVLRFEPDARGDPTGPPLPEQRRTGLGRQSCDNLNGRRGRFGS